MSSTANAQASAITAPSGRPWWSRRWLQVLATLLLVAGAGLLIGAAYLRRHAEPILRQRIIETLSARFDAPVALDRLDISLLGGIEVNGFGLRIPASLPTATPPGATPSAALIAVKHFTFRTTLRGLLRSPTHVQSVEVEGLELHIPPPGQRAAFFGDRTQPLPADPENSRLRPKIALVVHHLICRDVTLLIESGKPGKDPLEFDIAELNLQDVGRNRAMLYDAVLTNPKPKGLIHARGHFGPWAGRDPETTPPSSAPADPGQTPLDGDFTFDHADLNTIKGIGGILSSTGHFAGVLDHITVDGETDVPNFSLDLSDRPVPLHTRFHALVDGTSGDTFLQPVQAHLLGSDFTTSGKIVKIKGQGHDIDLEVDIPHGRMQDFLQLAVKTNPPLMNGVLNMKARLHIPPGKTRVPLKMAMAGAFGLQAVHFNNARLQDRLDGISARAQGHPEKVKEVSHDRTGEVRSRLSANFTMGNGILTVRDVRYAIPGALVLLNGVYSMDGKLFEFKGRVRTQATASQMVGGWKGWLLKPVDRFLKKDGAGLVLPIQITGTQGDVKLGLALKGADDTPAEMLEDLRDKQRSDRQLRRSRKETGEADQLDRAAAHAPTLEAARKAHDAAVARRAEALANARKAREDSHSSPGRQQP